VRVKVRYFLLCGTGVNSGCCKFTLSFFPLNLEILPVNVKKSSGSFLCQFLEQINKNVMKIIKRQKRFYTILRFFMLLTFVLKAFSGQTGKGRC